MPNANNTLIGFIGTIIVALIPVFSPYIRKGVRWIARRQTREPLPSGQEVGIRLRRFSLPILTLGLAITAFVMAYKTQHSKPDLAEISFDEKHVTRETEADVTIDVPEGAVAKVLIAAEAKAETDYTNNYRKDDEFRFQLTIKIIDDDNHAIAENTQWIPMFVNHHDPKQPPADPLDKPTSFLPAGVGTIPLSCSTSAILALNPGHHTIYAKTYANDTLTPTVRLNSLAIISRAAK